jgi:hypothetical protein
MSNDHHKRSMVCRQHSNGNEITHTHATRHVIHTLLAQDHDRPEIRTSITVRTRLGCQ